MPHIAAPDFRKAANVSGTTFICANVMPDAGESSFRRSTTCGPLIFVSNSAQRYTRSDFCSVLPSG